jgi:transcription elongation factor Elf1
MTCPNCGKDMTDWTLDGRVGTQVTVDVCTACQSFWFDQHQNLQLSPGSTLKLMKFIGEHSSTVKPTLSDVLECPRCGGPLSLTHDLVRNMHFNYWACASGHGKFIGFFDFLKEKNFIHALSAQEIQQLKQNVQTVNCSNCGASIDLQTNSSCPYCHSPIAMLDMKQQQQMLAQLQEAAAPKPVDPTLPLQLALATERTSALFKPDDTEWWEDAGSGDLVQAGLKLVARWITPSL